MEEEFELPVEYKGEEQMFNTKLIVTGYTHKFNVDVNGQSIVFELDDEGNYRAIIPYDDVPKIKSVDIELLKEIAKTIEEIIR